MNSIALESSRLGWHCHSWRLIHSDLQDLIGRGVFSNHRFFRGGVTSPSGIQRNSLLLLHFERSDALHEAVNLRIAVFEPVR